LKISKYLQEQLNSFGATTKLSRTTDTYVSLENRAKAANDWGANIFCSVHINAGGGTGIETWKHDNASSFVTKLASRVQSTLIRDLGVTDRKVKSCPSQRGGSNIYVIDPKNTRAWAILPEIMFIDTSSDADKLKKEDFLKKAGYAIAWGIRNFVENDVPTTN